ncbi:ORF-65 [Teiidae poxvirus 1]|nr:ORF-65 [Teiidae poxvirus 1]
MYSVVKQLHLTGQSIVDLLKRHKLKDRHNVVVTTVDDNTLIIINEDNVALVTRSIIFKKILFVKSHETTSAFVKRSGADIDEPNYFIPNSLALIDVLRKKACDLRIRELLIALLEQDVEELSRCDITSLNLWLYKNNLLDYRLIRLSDIDKNYQTFNRQNTVIDVVDKTYNVWVKNVVEYYTPSVIHWKHDLLSVSSADNWSKYYPTIDSLSDDIYAFEFIVSLEKTVEKVNIGAITLYPDKIITGNDVLKTFLSHLEDILYSSKNKVILAGYSIEFLEKPILKDFLKSSSEWAYCNKCLIHIKSGYEISFLDTAIFDSSSSKIDYVKSWTDKEIVYLNFFHKDKRLKHYIDRSNELHDRAGYLQEAILNHLCYLMEIFQIQGFDAHFSGLFDILVYSVLSKKENEVYYPSHSSAIDAITDSIYADFYCVSEITKNSKKLVFESILPIVANQYYPAGKPYYTQTPNDDLLSIMLCEVEIQGSNKNPILYSKHNKQDKHFTGIFTSVDIKAAVELSGYKIKILGCLEWPEKIIIFEDISPELILGDIIEDVNIKECGRNNLPIIAFIVSYCRSYTHTLLSYPEYNSYDIVKCKYNQAVYN